jgi:hypothetical protein
MHRRLGCAALVGAALACTTLALARTASAVPLCVPGQLVKTADPTLSAPSPTYVGNTITSSGGSWTSCGVSVTGFYKEWLRDGAVFSGPTWVAGLPGPFTYLAQTADVGHRLTSAVRPCNSEGCYGSYAGSTNAVVPVAQVAPPPPPPPPPPPGPPAPMKLYFDEGFDYSVADEFGNVISQQSMDNLPDGSYEISPYGGAAGVYAESTAQPLLGSITGATSSFSLAVARTLCYTVDKQRTAHDSVTYVVVWKFHQKVRWCATYPKIDEHSLTVDSFFSNVDPLFQVDWDDHGTGGWYTWRGSATGGHYSRRQGKIDNCFFKWGCIFSHYPQIEVWVNGNGAWAAK